MTQIVPVNWTPDVDTNWLINPGALTTLYNFAPLQNGFYGSMGSAAYLAGSITGSDIKIGYMFRKIDGTVRLILARTQNLDEYDSSGTRTNQGTGYSVSTDTWTMCAYGNAIIATNYLDAPQVSTSTTFGALAGSPPKARLCAANELFVMLADYDDGTNQYGDGWACSGIGNHQTWAASIATQAARGRLLDTPGPIRALVAYGDAFVAFKDNGVYLGEYIGPPFTFGWRCISQRLGCVGPYAVAECDGKLYFMHSSGFYEFDGASFRNVGLPIWQRWATLVAYASRAGYVGIATTISDSLYYSQAIADDIEGVVWWNNNAESTPSGGYNRHIGYNARNGKWGLRVNPLRTGGWTGDEVAVKASTADVQSFKATGSARYVFVSNGAGNVRYMAYPADTETGYYGYLGTGLYGEAGKSRRPTRLRWRTTYGSETDSGITVSVASYNKESLVASSQTGGGTATLNTEFDAADLRSDGMFTQYTIQWSSAITTVLAGLGFDDAESGKR